MFSGSHWLPLRYWGRTGLSLCLQLLILPVGQKGSSRIKIHRFCLEDTCFFRYLPACLSSKNMEADTWRSQNCPFPLITPKLALIWKSPQRSQSHRLDTCTGNLIWFSRWESQMWSLYILPNCQPLELGEFRPILPPISDRRRRCELLHTTIPQLQNKREIRTCNSTTQGRQWSPALKHHRDLLSTALETPVLPAFLFSTGTACGSVDT